MFVSITVSSGLQMYYKISCRKPGRDALKKRFLFLYSREILEQKAHVVIEENQAHR